MMTCRNCGRVHENVRGKCPHCGADSHGHVREKRVTQPRDLDKYLQQLRCPHRHFLYRPCPKCERSSEECEVYRRDILARIIKFGIAKSEAERMLAALDLIEAG